MDGAIVGSRNMRLFTWQRCAVVEPPQIPRLPAADHRPRTPYKILINLMGFTGRRSQRRFAVSGSFSSLLVRSNVSAGSSLGRSRNTQRAWTSSPLARRRRSGCEASPVYASNGTRRHPYALQLRGASVAHKIGLKRLFSLTAH